METRTKKFVLAGVLGAISVVLSITPLGLIPVPNLSSYATTMHIPAIIGGIIGGPGVGALVGLILAFSTLHLFAGNVLACFLPRILIGVVAYYIWRWSGKKDWGIVLGSLGGTFTNTIGVLGLMVVTGFFTWEQVLPVLVLNGVLELVISGILALPLVRILKRVVKI
ncbi:MAG: ECF transporter S component [Candidatus Atribacteria bacterium]|nr:ECF transporter S component [Candidatus Atribacteria bacterium]